jgi:hypothetical protein
MTDKVYQMIESVGNAHENIHTFEDIAKHHPTWKEDPKHRFYGELEGKREEFVFAPGGEKMLSKDIVFKVDGSNHVPIPSPFEGYAKLNEKWGTVDIYEQPNGQGHLIGRVRHMEPILVTENQHIGYGQPLGMQGGKNGKDPSKPFGPHAHIDVSMSHLEQFKQYVLDVNSGVIAPSKYPSKNTESPTTDKEYRNKYDIEAQVSSLEISKTAQTLIADATHHVQKWITDNGLQWNEQFNQAAHSVASAAHEKGMTGINLFAVNDGQIDFGHKEGFMLKTGSIETAVASNTDIAKSLQAMSDIDRTQSQTHSHTQQQAHTQTNERGMRMG